MYAIWPLLILSLDMPTIQIEVSVKKKQKKKQNDSVDPDETTHLDLYCLQRYLCVLLSGPKRLNVIVCIAVNKKIVQINVVWTSPQCCVPYLP